MAFAVISIVVLEAGQGSCQAQMTAEEFDSLGEADKRTLLVSTLQERERFVRNLQTSSVTNIYTAEYRDGKTHTRLDDVARYVCELRRKDGNHWASIDWFLPDKPERPNQKVVTSLDFKSGIARSVAEQDTLEGVYGAIDTKEDMLIQAGRFHYWFDGKFDDPQNFPISFLLTHQDAIKFEGLSVDGQEIQISLHVESNKGTPYQDTRTLWLDPQRGFMPVRMHWWWEYDSRPPLNSNVYTEIKRMDQIDGVWFPTHFIETCTSRKSVAEKFATVYETTVGSIKLGVMSDDDLKVHFDEKVQVHDRLKGVWSSAAKATQSAPLVQRTPASARIWLVAVNLFVILGFAAIVTLRSAQKKLKDAHEE